MHTCVIDEDVESSLGTVNNISGGLDGCEVPDIEPYKFDVEIILFLELLPVTGVR